jgi:hypothetical protein
MPSKSNKEGYLLIDHRNSPGVSVDVIRASGKDAPIVGEGQMLEAAVLTCSHCTAQIIRNPARTRERAYCRGCDHYICDGCEAKRVASGGQCDVFTRKLDRTVEIQHNWLLTGEHNG